MVDVTVGQNIQDRLEFLFSDRGENLLRIIARIHHNRFGGSLAGEKKAVRLKRADGQGLDAEVRHRLRRSCR
jgi:hypothetical protein